jgi:hypothetical protein
LSEIVRVTWCVTPLHPPLPRRHCRSCNATRPFINSGRFRTNAQKKCIDVWLIYRCAACDETWNMPIVERRPITRMPSDQIQSFIRNDPAAAARHAFDLALLARYCDQIDQDVAVAVQKRVESGNLADAVYLEVAIALSLPCRLRLDALLARELDVTRSALLRAYEAGVIMLVSRKAIRAPAFDGQRIRIDLSKARLWGIDLDRLLKQAT